MLRYSALPTALIYLSFLVGCASTPQPVCKIGEEQFINDLLYFGTAKPKGVVNSDEWQEFLRTTVTPRFPDGFTYWPVQGQWQGMAGAIVRETTYLLNFNHPDDNRSETAINAIINE
ncbi:hypothetical protein MCAMS1_01950 [biofilm metagenome]